MPSQQYSYYQQIARQKRLSSILELFLHALTISFMCPFGCIFLYYFRHFVMAGLFGVMTICGFCLIYYVVKDAEQFYAEL